MASALGQGCLGGKAARGSGHSSLQRTRVQRQQSTYYPPYHCPQQKARRQPTPATKALAASSAIAEQTNDGLGLWEAAGGTAATHASSWGLNSGGELGLPLDFTTYYQLGRQIGAGAYGTVYEAIEK